MAAYGKRFTDPARHFAKITVFLTAPPASRIYLTLFTTPGRKEGREKASLKADSRMAPPVWHDDREQGRP